MDSGRRRELKSLAQAFFDGSEYRPAQGSSLADRFALAKGERAEFPELLHELQEEGVAVYVEGRGWCSPRREGWVVGTLQVSSKGFGFVRPVREDSRGDLFIPTRKVKDGHDGDLVLARTRKPKRGRSRRPSASAPRREGAVILVLRRSSRIIPGVYYRSSHGGGIVEPLRHGGVRELYIAPGRAREARDGERVLARLLDGPTVSGLPPGEVVERAAAEGTWLADLQVVAAEFDLREEFPTEVMEEVAAIPGDISQEKRSARTDLRDHLIFTIDPRDAEDRDDAITCEENADGSWRLGVFIADVSHFVRPGSAVDREAYRRGTSVYLAGRVYPMLPPRLSNELCSLDPGKDRLVKALWMEFSPAGERVGHHVERALIRSSFGLSYSEAQQILAEPESAKSAEPLPRMLAGMERLRALLYRRRVERGSLDLDLPEQRILLDDDGEVIDVGVKERTGAHRLIEEFMLAANETVASLATSHGLPIVRRVHPEPPEEDLKNFSRFCRVMVPDVRVRGVEDFEALLRAVRDRPAAPIINLALLRTLTRAEYDVHKSLHYALATDEYCHFTSPIRRYPDLQVHRVLDSAIFGERARGYQVGAAVELKELAKHSTATERRAEEAEREMAKLRVISWLHAREGEHFHGVITAVLDFGFFVRLEENLSEGMVHISTLRDDFFVLQESQFALRGRNTGKSFRLGDPIEVRLVRADPINRQIDLKYLHHRNE